MLSKNVAKSAYKLSPPRGGKYAERSEGLLRICDRAVGLLGGGLIQLPEYLAVYWAPDQKRRTLPRLPRTTNPEAGRCIRKAKGAEKWIAHDRVFVSAARGKAER